MNIGDELAELALQFGADDIDGTVQQESIMHLAGSTTPLTHDLQQLSKLINDAGCVPVKRDTIYTEFESYVPPKPAKRLPWHEVSDDATKAKMDEHHWSCSVHELRPIVCWIG